MGSGPRWARKGAQPRRKQLPALRGGRADSRKLGQELRLLFELREEVARNVQADVQCVEGDRFRKLRLSFWREEVVHASLARMRATAS